MCGPDFEWVFGRPELRGGMQNTKHSFPLSSGRGNWRRDRRVDLEKELETELKKVMWRRLQGVTARVSAKVALVSTERCEEAPTEAIMAALLLSKLNIWDHTWLSDRTSTIANSGNLSCVASWISLDWLFPIPYISSWVECQRCPNRMGMTREKSSAGNAFVLRKVFFNWVFNNLN